MRAAALVFAAALAVFAYQASATAQSRDSAFPVERGTAPPPPAETAGQALPPQGQTAGGFDFGQWRGAQPETYSGQWRTQLRARFAGQTQTQIRADLEANGFACADQQSGRLHCRIEAMEQQCALDWYVVVERPNAEPIAGFDRMCLGAQ